LGLLAPTVLIGWYTALCFCRRMETLQFVFFGVPLLVVVGGGACFAVLGILRALAGAIGLI
jgi:hypothetical protein